MCREIYWTQWSSDEIFKAGMDGSNARVIVKGGLNYPEGISVDVENSKIYWLQDGGDKVETANFDGGERRVIVGTSADYDVDVFRGKVYWGDDSYRIRSCTLSGACGEGAILSNTGGIALAIIHPEKQPQTRINNCATRGCSHICVLKGTNGAVCLCADGFTLGSDGISCS